MGLAITVLILVFVPGDLRRGFFAGIAATMTVGGMCFFVAHMSGSAPTTMGAVAEQWTAGELRRLTREGWRLINGFQLRVRDVDHVLVGPAGVIAVETKWSRDAWLLDPRDVGLASAASQVQKNAWDLEHWEDLKRLQATPVRAALFLWSAAPVPEPVPTSHVRIADVSVIYGSAARRAWLDAVRTATKDTRFTPDRIEDVWAALNKRLVQRAESLPARQHLPSLTRIYWTAVGILLLAGAALYLTVDLFAIFSQGWIWAASSLAAAFVSAMMARIRHARPFAAAVIAGIALGAVYIAAAEIYLGTR